MKQKIAIAGFIIVVAVVVVLQIIQPKQTGYIKIDTPGIKTKMSLRRGWWSQQQVSSDAESVELPVRKYRPRRISLAAQKGGNEWVISGLGPWGELAKIKVKKDQTTVLKPGPPFLIKSNVRRRGQTLSISPLVIGQAGEHYDVRVRTRRGSLPAPGLKIVDESGKVLVSDKFRFG
ncbi:MAG: hypothetical protein GWN67_05290 [Phycisphaerae bacterium]|nr:hypothetical protein [Phycisphaerae bacterium]NIP51385.1 hypothetical protein [Phycisphaerae bacterium]NIS50584.1 hypothetical protein [Phycisphaerae bacterium]NIU08323.1 hypothetical protein [Phycisphaerae bacterium]NIU55815.1 hypothetical protein [Phycisphaerae bacterium]